MSLDGKHRTQITNLRSRCERPRYLPDGASVAFIAPGKDALRCLFAVDLVTRAVHPIASADELGRSFGKPAALP